MNRTIYLSILLIILPLAFFNVPQAQATPAPNFSINEKQQLSDLKGKVVYVDFWASWCGPCRESFPWLNKITKQYNSQGLVVLSVNVDSDKNDAAKFLTKYPANFSVTYDPQMKIAELYNVMGMPSSYIIDRKGKIQATHVGFFQHKAEKYERQIQQALAKQ